MVWTFIVAGFVVIILATALLHAYTVAGAMLVLLWIANIIHYVKAKKVIASEMVCPKCGSSNVTVRDQDGDKKTTLTKTSHIIPQIGTCQDCGNEYQHVPIEEIEKQQKRATGGVSIVTLCLIIYVIMYFYTR
jgi:hypothetical protein